MICNQIVTWTAFAILAMFYNENLFMLLMVILNKECSGPHPTACSISQGRLALFTVTISLGLRFEECFSGNVKYMFLLSSCLEWITQTAFGRRRATAPLNGRKRQEQLQVAEMISEWMLMYIVD